jgi:cytochrome c553
VKESRLQLTINADNNTMTSSLSKYFISSIIYGCIFLPSLTFAMDGESIMIHGGANPAAMPCISCHAPDGKGMPSAGFPRLSGLPAPYIEKQLYDFRSGSRKNSLMQGIASALTNDEITAVANAYAKRPKVNVNRCPNSGERRLDCATWRME